MSTRNEQDQFTSELTVDNNALDDQNDRINLLRSPFGADRLQGTERPRKSSSFRQQRPTAADHRPVGRQLTLRALLVGLMVGSILCCSNTYFGLQSGWVTMGSLQSAILGFGIFKILHSQCGLRSLSIGENVIVQTTAVATATMPLAAGLVGVIPAFKLMDPPLVFNPGQLILWSLALAFIGVFSAIPLRTQTIVKEKLKFPSGTATANVIETLHAAAPSEDISSRQPIPASLRQRHSTLESLPERIPLQSSASVQDELSVNETPSPARAPLNLNRTRSKGLHSVSARSLLKADSMQRHSSLDSKWTSMRLEGGQTEFTDFSKSWRILLTVFLLSGIYSLAANLWQPLKSFPIFTWMGLPILSAWGWELSPSMGYIGQGMIMGPRTAFSMLLGAITGFGILGPIAKSKGWAPGEISNANTGATGWILWISLAIMLADSMTSLAILCWFSVKSVIKSRRSRGTETQEEDSGKGRLPTWLWVSGLIVTGAFCTGVLTPMLNMKVYEPIVAVILALLVAILAVRALGETDLNPVSGVGKLSQVIFAVIAPRQVVANLTAGAIAEAGASQAGDMMQDFKTAYLLNVCPRDQFIAMLIGSGASVFVSVGAYMLFTTSYEVPGPLFPAPSAEIWLDMAELVNGGHLPPRVAPFCIAGAVFGAALPLLAAFFEAKMSKLEGDLESGNERLKIVATFRRFLPSGIGFAVGMYVQAKWTIPRVLGSLLEQLWLWQLPKSHSSYMIIVASGLVLGEGTFSIVAAAIQAFLHS